jgi:hypothetical protein
MSFLINYRKGILLMTPLAILKSRLTKQKVPWANCHTWTYRLDEIELLGWGQEDVGDDLFYLCSRCIPYKNLPFYVGIHTTLDKIIGRVLNGDTYPESTRTWCRKVRDYNALFN